MLFFIIAWSLFLIVCFPLGNSILALTGEDGIDRPGDRLIIALWLGIVVLGILMLTASFFLPLTPVTATVVAGLTLAGSLSTSLMRVQLAKLLSLLRLWHVCLYLVFVSVVAAFMTQPVVCIDAGLYHIQTVKWLSQYGSVPGVAFIHGRLGFTSSWFALAAPFHSGSFGARSTAIMSGLALCWVLSHGAILIYRFITFRVGYEDWFILIGYVICVPYALGLNSAISSSPDLPVMYLTLIIGLVILIITGRKAENDEKPSINSRAIPLILSAGALAVKLSAAPLLIISLLFYLMGKGAFRKRILSATLICGLMVTPVMVSGMITSGCPFYPAPFLCFESPWSVGAELAGKVNTINQNYERWTQYTPPDNTNWLIPWAKRNPDFVIFIIVCLIGCFVAVFSSGLKDTTGRFWILAIAALGIIFVFSTVPARRLALGYFALPPALVAPRFRKIAFPLILIIPLIFQADMHTRPINFALLLFSISVYVYLLFAKNSFLQSFAPSGFIVIAAFFPIKALLTPAISNVSANVANRSFWLVPPAVEKSELEIWANKQVNDFKYIQSERPYPDGRCWASDLPCTPWLLHENIKLRDPKRGLGAGVVRAD
jgi:hypothetical protein